ncbi:MAG: sensor histidine kinase [Anaerorhabdus sp.]
MIIEYLWEFLINIADYAISITFFSLFIESKNTDKIKLLTILWIIVMASIMQLLSFQKYNIEVTLFVLISMIFYNFIFYNGKPRTKALLPFIALFFFSIIELIVSSIAIQILNIDQMQLLTNQKYIFFMTLVTRLLVSFVLYRISSIYKKNINSNEFLKYYIAVPIISCIIIMILMELYYTELINDSLILIPVAIVLLNFIFFSIMKKLKEKTDKLSAIEQQALFNEKSQAQYVQVVDAYNSIRKWKHDYTKIISTIQELNHSENYDSLNLFLKEIGNEFEDDSYCILTGNNYLDALLNYEIKKCKDLKINISLDLCIPSLDFMKKVDLCSIFGNILDNAIEASEKCTIKNKKCINLKARIDNNMLVISCKNNFKIKPRLSGEEIISIKKKRNHGLGIKTIKSLAEKYDGLINIKIDDEIFEITSIIPLLISSDEMINIFKFESGVNNEKN